MGIFGWSYPPGCSGTPYDECPDGDACAFCGQELPEDAQPDSWAFEGYCDAECAARELLHEATFTDDALHASQRKTMERALDELARSYRERS